MSHKGQVFLRWFQESIGPLLVGSLVIAGSTLSVQAQTCFGNAKIAPECSGTPKCVYGGGQTQCEKNEKKEGLILKPCTVTEGKEVYSGTCCDVGRCSATLVNGKPVQNQEQTVKAAEDQYKQAQPGSDGATTAPPPADTAKNALPNPVPSGSSGTEATPPSPTQSILNQYYGDQRGTPGSGLPGEAPTNWNLQDAFNLNTERYQTSYDPVTGQATLERIPGSSGVGSSPLSDQIQSLQLQPQIHDTGAPPYQPSIFDTARYSGFLQDQGVSPPQDGSNWFQSAYEQVRDSAGGLARWASDQFSASPVPGDSLAALEQLRDGSSGLGRTAPQEVGDVQDISMFSEPDWMDRIPNEIIPQRIQDAVESGVERTKQFFADADDAWNDLWNPSQDIPADSSLIGEDELTREQFAEKQGKEIDDAQKQVFDGPTQEELNAIDQAGKEQYAKEKVLRDALAENDRLNKMVNEEMARRGGKASVTGEGVPKKLTVYYPGGCTVGVDPGCSPGIEGPKVGSRSNPIDRSTPVIAAGPNSGLKFGDVVKISHPTTGQTTFAVVGDVCPACGSGFDATPGVYQALGSYADTNGRSMLVETVSRGNSWGSGLAQVQSYGSDTSSYSSSNASSYDSTYGNADSGTVGSMQAFNARLSSGVSSDSSSVGLDDSWGWATEQYTPVQQLPVSYDVASPPVADAGYVPPTEPLVSTHYGSGNEGGYQWADSTVTPPDDSFLFTTVDGSSPYTVFDVDATQQGSFAWDDLNIYGDQTDVVPPEPPVPAIWDNVADDVRGYGEWVTERAAEAREALATAEEYTRYATDAVYDLWNNDVGPYGVAGDDSSPTTEIGAAEAPTDLSNVGSEPVEKMPAVDETSPPASEIAAREPIRSDESGTPPSDADAQKDAPGPQPLERAPIDEEQQRKEREAFEKDLAGKTNVCQFIESRGESCQSRAARESLYKEMGFTDRYSGSAAQNQKLLAALKDAARSEYAARETDRARETALSDMGSAGDDDIPFETGRRDPISMVDDDQTESSDITRTTFFPNGQSEQVTLSENGDYVKDFVDKWNISLGSESLTTLEDGTKLLKQEGDYFQTDEFAGERFKERITRYRSDDSVESVRTVFDKDIVDGNREVVNHFDQQGRPTANVYSEQGYEYTETLDPESGEVVSVREVHPNVSKEGHRLVIESDSTDQNDKDHVFTRMRLEDRAGNTVYSIEPRVSQGGEVTLWGSAPGVEPVRIASHEVIAQYIQRQIDEALKKLEETTP